MGNKATTTTKNGKKKRTARRTSVLLQQLTDKEYRQGQLNIKGIRKRSRRCCINITNKSN